MISIVTPVYNGARFLREAIESVLRQRPEDIEYVVVDGGSTDGTCRILEEYAGRLSVLHGPDRGQADAINRGVASTHGEIIGILNADDIYAPNALEIAADAFRKHPTAAVVYGEAVYIDAAGREIERYPTLAPEQASLFDSCFICQPAAFVRRAAFEAVGGMDVQLRFSLDYDLWLRLTRRGSLIKVDQTLAFSRMHAGSRTLASRGASYRESMETIARHAGYVPYPWVYAYASWLLDRKDHYLEPARPSLLKVGLSLPLGVAINRKSPLRYAADWFGHRRLGRITKSARFGKRGS